MPDADGYIGLPVVCSAGHVSEDLSSIVFEPGTQVADLTLMDNHTWCPECGKPARMISGQFSLVDGVLKATKMLGSRDDWLAIIAAIRDLPIDVDFSVAISELAGALPEPIAQAVRELPPLEPGESVARWKIRTIKALAALSVIVGTEVAVKATDAGWDALVGGDDPPAVVQQTTVNDGSIFNGPVTINPGPQQSPRRAPTSQQQPHRSEKRRSGESRRRVDPMKGKAPSRGNGKSKQRSGGNKPKPPQD